MPKQTPTDESISANRSSLVQSGETGETFDNNDVYQLADGVYIEALFPYTGTFVEDGSNTPCENIAAVRISNYSEIPYQYIRFSITTETTTYIFEGSTLMANVQMTIQNSDRKEYRDEGIISSELLNISPFVNDPSLYSELFQITYTDRIINLKNLSDRSFEQVYVYYKNIEDNGYFGGITYRIPFEKIVAGQIMQNVAENIHKDSSAIVFVTYEE